MGCSAGGHLSACLSTFNEDWSKADDAADRFPFHPNFTILISPVISMGEMAHKGSKENLLGKNPPEKLINQFSCDLRVSPATPPAFIVHAANDKSVSPLNSIQYYTALFKNKVAKSTLHIFPEGGHNIALRNNPGTTEEWTQLAESWLKEIAMLR